MTRAANPLFNLLLISSAFCGLGCQRSMNGGMATGPFAPAGTATTGANALIPMGPLTGATRVPPPATGSSNPSNGYLGAPSASTFAPSPNNAMASGPSVPGTGFAPMAASPDNTFRSTLGGMNVIDLTNQAASPNQLAVMPASAAAYPGAAIGSGVAYASPHVAETAARAQQPADLLRPIDQPYASAVRPAGGFPLTDPWKSTQSLPSTAPISSQAPVVQTASPSLPWRSPSAAR